MERNSGLRRPHFDDDVFDFRGTEHEAFTFNWRDHDCERMGARIARESSFAPRSTETLQSDVKCERLRR